MKTDEYIIEARTGWFSIPWREILQYRDLLWLLVRRDFVAQYKQTVLGPLWFIIQPVLTSLVFTVVFGMIVGVGTDEVPPLLFYMCGMLAWGYFAGCLGQTSATFVANAGIFGKVYFPRLIVPFAVIISKLISFAIQLITFLVFWGIFKCTAAGGRFTMSAYIVLLPLLLLQTAAIGLGVGLWMSALTAKYRDFTHISGFLTQLWLYATPVVYPFSKVPAKWQMLVALNPMTAVVELYRKAFLGAGTVDPAYIGTSVGVTLIMLITGLLAFNRVEKNFVDTV